MIGKNSYRIYWCSREELVVRFGGELLESLTLRGAVQVWPHEAGEMAVTLTPWCAEILGFRLAEYWVRHTDRLKEYRGVGRKLARIRVQRWDTEAYWVYRDRPERSIHIPGNTCELPLAGDPEDKSYHRDQQEYLEDWQTFTFTKDPKKAITITIRVGSFAHQIIVERDRHSCIPSRTRKRKHDQNRDNRATATDRPT